MDRPTPEEYQPWLTPWRHAWRLVAAAVVSLLLWTLMLDVRPASTWLLVVDVVGGVVCAGLVLGRRRRPMSTALVTNVVAIVSASASGPALLASVSLATRRRPREIVVLAVLLLVCSSLFFRVHPFEPAVPSWVAALSSVALATLQLAWGMYIGSRRELVWELSRRAERAEADRDERGERARENERARIAREMHDVLGHRISQISMHAGAHAFRDDLTNRDLRDGMTAIREHANAALTDLRGVLGVLRDERTGVPVDAPTPTYADVALLVGSARAAGIQVDFADGLEPDGLGPDGKGPPGPVGRTVYRILQEGLTNAGKHAPGAPVVLRVEGGPGAGIDVEVRNPVVDGTAPRGAQGSGFGLIGLSERAVLSGGRLDHLTENGYFVLRGWVPWPD